MASLPGNEFTILESDLNMSVCITLLAGNNVKVRNVIVRVFTSDGSAIGEFERV